MLWIIRTLISLALGAVLVWFALTVPLGKRTLVGHLRAIATTDEAKDFARGTEEEAKKAARKLDEELHPPDLAPSKRHVHEPLAPADERRR